MCLKFMPREPCVGTLRDDGTLKAGAYWEIIRSLWVSILEGINAVLTVTWLTLTNLKSLTPRISLHVCLPCDHSHTLLVLHCFLPWGPHQRLHRWDSWFWTSSLPKYEQNSPPSTQHQVFCYSNWKQAETLRHQLLHCLLHRANVIVFMIVLTIQTSAKVGCISFIAILTVYRIFSR